jgi:sec-independent protein translocase protein TatC
MALVPFPGPQSGAHRKPPDDEDDDAAGAKMSFLEHLDELRKRIINSLIAVIVGVCLSFFFIDRIRDFLLAPAMRVLPKGSQLMYTEPNEAFSFLIWVGFIAGGIVAAPYIMYQFWMFIAPGLYSHEKRMAVPFVAMSSAGFIIGALFNHYVVFPWMMVFFGSFNTADLRFMPKLDAVFDLYTKMLIGMGLIFQMPTIVYFLAKMRVITARFLWRNFRYAILIIFIIAAIITPTGDMVNQTVFAAPMIGLYLLSIAIAWIVNPRKRADEDTDKES